MKWNDLYFALRCLDEEQKYKLLKLMSEYDSMLWSDEYMGVSPGCDCGCGGDYYSDNSDAWDEMVEVNDRTKLKIKKFCEETVIEFDIDIE